MIERAGMLPSNELRFALSCLLPVVDLLAERDRPAWQRLVDDCETVRGLGTGAHDGLTQVFLHGDAHPWNSVLTSTGAVALVDWDSSGPGPAVIDLGFLAVSCATGGLIGPLARPDPTRLDAVLAGYTGEMTLTPADLDAFEFALSFRVLVCAAVGFATMVRDGRRPLEEESIIWSLDRLKAIPAIARQARACLEVRR